ncbi:twin-arginine translocation signal domain-containing protein [Bradyrhizobium sp. CCGUVB1N3]|uniref:twin-arginine translocation signal domain-containing protein n=1 Tax=Bradyrhizobium sp. CCGUVB1N3 TaxID=2949629 RepID=UPI0020B2892F|nr:twin-arginine translocation signal domain-containing protein [Bradyrhizobium sp. CCGUVB1N3]MCP3470822.1 twin-arginine translocation signal domain-containing protein [Bradyrhizobium sp. CCGUVB1N3]
MNAPTRRAFLGFAQNAVAAAAIGAIGVRLIESAEAMPIAPDLGLAGKPDDLVTTQGWGPSPAPGWGSPGWGRPPPPPPRRRRRWVCWWHRGRRHCGWRWR